MKRISLIFVALLLEACVSSHRFPSLEMKDAHLRDDCVAEANNKVLNRDGKHYVDCVDYGTTTMVDQIDIDTSTVERHIRAAIVDNFQRRRKLLTAECHEELDRVFLECVESKHAKSKPASQSGKTTERAPQTP